MTPRRAGSKAQNRWMRRARLGVLSGFVAASCLISPGRAATTEFIVTDPLTGIAIFGFDPVAFFVDHRARKGSPFFEFKHAGVVWRFHNEGDRAAFAAHPAIYMPRFGGYDPMAAARRVPAPGLPALFVLHENRLFLFSSKENRKAFLAAPGEAIAAAESSWPRLAHNLVP